MKVWLRVLFVIGVILPFFLLQATHGQLGRLGELPLWYSVVLAGVMALLLWQAVSQPINQLTGKARGAAVGLSFGLFMLVFTASEQLLSPHPSWGKPVFLGLGMGVVMGWIYRHSAAEKELPGRHKRV